MYTFLFNSYYTELSRNVGYIYENENEVYATILFSQSQTYYIHLYASPVWWNFMQGNLQRTDRVRHASSWHSWCRVNDQLHTSRPTLFGFHPGGFTALSWLQSVCPWLLIGQGITSTPLSLDVVTAWKNNKSLLVNME